MFKLLKYHEKEVSSQAVCWQHLFSVLPFILTNSEKLGCFFYLLTLRAFSLRIPRAAVHHHMKMERGRIVKEWTEKNTETLPLAGSAPAIQRIWIHTMKDFVVFLLYFLTGFFFNFIKTIFLLRLVVQSYFSRTTIQSDSVSADKLPTDPFLTSILL